MGVVRDVTIDQLTQAVQGISSTGISDSTGQAINNTLGTLGKDTSLQSIAAAISALGTTLGANKADIDGGNIVNPSAFRTNIGLTTSTTTLTTPVSQIFRQFIKNHYGVVYLYLDINNYTSTTAQIIGYLPIGFRPYHRILTDVIVINANDNSFKGYAHFVIQPTGEITLQMQGSYTYPFCTLDISFPVSST